MQNTNLKPHGCEKSIVNTNTNTLAKSIADTNTNTTVEKYCQYQYQYFFGNTFFAPHHINAVNNSNCNPTPNPTHTPDPT